ncbi:MAG TPA: site-specific integrase, partial [Planctomycetota bacterium]|nr:site-specific integrase [Planctomycetota bacterium]
AELHHDDVPEADQAAWDDLFRPGDILHGRGEAVHWAAATRRTNAKHYARWLGWLAATGRLDADADPWQRATPGRIEAYARSLIDRLAPRTAASAVIGLKCVLLRMHPAGDWRWLRDLTNRLDRWAKPSRADRERILPAGDVFRRLLAELARTAAGPLAKRREQLALRDTLLCAVLSVCPIRLRNVAMMELDRHLYRLGDEWHLRFNVHETKTAQPIHLVLPRELDPFLDVYLDEGRPKIPGTADGAHVWPACKGRPMAEGTIYAAVRKRSRELLGVALNPHAFRGIAATFLAESTPADALHARPLLGHRQGETTERYYIRASQLDASRSVTAAFRQIRDA